MRLPPYSDGNKRRLEFAGDKLTPLEACALLAYLDFENAGSAWDCRGIQNAWRRRCAANLERREFKRKAWAWKKVAQWLPEACRMLQALGWLTRAHLYDKRELTTAGRAAAVWFNARLRKPLAMGDFVDLTQQVLAQVDAERREKRRRGKEQRKREYLAP